ncbi:MAG: hypothetical protein J1F05_07300 [Muribaculaceae bacterium]|nr:hypothetical protein [Muribaculaceae bacterium]
MKKLTFLCMAVVLATVSFVRCNSDYTDVENLSSNIVVYSFNLTADDNVLENLDTVFFSIDLDRKRIYNADSLPFGTKTDRLIPVIRLVETASRATLTVHRADGTDSIYDYLTNSTDSIDFSNGPVTLDVTSPSGAITGSYSIFVNVHQLKTDSLVWNESAKRPLPTTIENPVTQRTVQTGDGVYCLVIDDDNSTIAYSQNPGNEDWDIYAIELPTSADVATFSATDTDLYILANGTLYTSADGGKTWNSTGEEWYSIYGGYTNRITGVKKTDDGYVFVEYPTEIEPMPIPEDMPVSDVSVPLSFSFAMSPDPQIIMVGGVLADGSLSNATWAFDGKSWAKISTKSLPEGIKGITVVPFFSFRVNRTFVVTKDSILLAFGGICNGELNRTVYVSSNYGMTWNTGGELVQLPEHVPSMAYAQAYVYESILPFEDAADDWIDFETSYRIPANASLLFYPETTSRATEDIDTWPCPYIYVFGGVSEEGLTYNTVWRATINRLTFKPIL